VRTKTIGEQKAAGGGVGDATTPLGKKSQANKSEREECEEEEELLWREREREREREWLIRVPRKEKKKMGFITIMPLVIRAKICKNATDHLNSV
jgi:hypothetical protein